MTLVVDHIERCLRYIENVLVGVNHSNVSGVAHTSPHPLRLGVYRPTRRVRSFHWCLNEVASHHVFSGCAYCICRHLIFGAACGGGDRSSRQDAAIGEEITDGQFTFTADTWECGARTVSRGLISVDATGTYCFLTVRMFNSGDAARRFVATSQRLLDDQGRRLDVAQRESVLMNPGDIGAELNPGLAIEVLLVFDVADPEAIVAAELHDGVLSRGARIALSG